MIISLNEGLFFVHGESAGQGMRMDGERGRGALFVGAQSSLKATQTLLHPLLCLYADPPCDPLAASEGTMMRPLTTKGFKTGLVTEAGHDSTHAIRCCRREILAISLWALGRVPCCLFKVMHVGRVYSSELVYSMPDMTVRWRTGRDTGILVHASCFFLCPGSSPFLSLRTFDHCAGVLRGAKEH